MDIKEYRAVVQNRIEKAFMAGLQRLNAEAIEFIPEHSGDLRSTATVKMGGSTRRQIEAELITGGEARGTGRKVEYARYQYYKPLRHIMAGGKPRRIVDAFPQAGGGLRRRYGRAYYRMRKAGAGSRVALRWYERAIRSGADRRAQDVILNYYRKL